MMNAEFRNLPKSLLVWYIELAALKYTGAGGKHAQTGALIEEHILETDTQLYLKCKTHWSIISQPYLGICNLQLFPRFNCFTVAWLPVKQCPSTAYMYRGLRLW